MEKIKEVIVRRYDGLAETTISITATHEIAAKIVIYVSELNKEIENKNGTPTITS